MGQFTKFSTLKRRTNKPAYITQNGGERVEEAAICSVASSGQDRPAKANNNYLLSLFLRLSSND
jgi:hypothetical protein